MGWLQQLKKKYPPPPHRVTLSELIEKTGQSQRDFAKVVKVDSSYVSLVCSGKRTPSMSVAKRMADGLGLTLDQFWEAIQRERE